LKIYDERAIPQNSNFRPRIGIASINTKLDNFTAVRVISASHMSVDAASGKQLDPIEEKTLENGVSDFPQKRTSKGIFQPTCPIEYL
jgi:hypothetical protein